MTPQQILAIKLLFAALFLGAAALLVLVWETVIEWIREDGLSTTTVALAMSAIALTAVICALAYFMAVSI